MPEELHLKVDPALCEGHALCIDLAPEVFDLGDDEIAAVVGHPRSWDSAKAAVDACPRQAISMETQS